jgi:RNA polymerase sigma-70 factor (ECF subfamily)
MARRVIPWCWSGCQASGGALARVLRLSQHQGMGSVSRDVEPRFARRRERMLETERLPDHADRLYRAAYALCGTSHDAEDLVQETFERVLRRPRFIRREGDLAYLLRALRNTWIAMRRAQASRARTVELREEVEWVVDHGADPGTTALEVRASYGAIRELTEPLREAIVAVDVVGLSYRQAARALRVREGTIMSRLFRARERVAAQLEGVAT